MAVEKEKNGGGIFKSMVTSLIGLISGAVIMSLSPLVNSAIKPPKPVSNFSFARDAVATRSVLVPPSSRQTSTG